ncbi:MAG TPA: MFS transporter [Hyphomicrobiaceae bacterium]|nr:MFS transporter [Hyphomicrobiaceae bacterium]
MPALPAAYAGTDSCPPSRDGRRTLCSAGVAHALHDGFTDAIYVLLPVWQAEFGLGYGALALLRGLYAGAMAALQVPAGRLAEKLDGRAILAVGTLLAGAGYALAGCSGGLLGLCGALVLSGAGSSTQHPIASAAVSRAYGAAARGPLGTYNFTGDLGKAAIPALVSLLLTLVSWRTSLWLLAALGAATAVVVALLMPPVARAPAIEAVQRKPGKGGSGRGFWLLFVIGMLDTGVRMGVMTFLPFLLQAKGASLPTIGLGLALVFIGGAAGKFACGWLGARFGVLRTMLLTEGLTALGIGAILLLPLLACLLILPLLGIVLNGTSSVVYGSVPELVPAERAERAFALFYTGAIGSGAIAPVAFGLLGDVVGITSATVATAIVALATYPLAFALAPHLSEAPQVG